MKQLSVSGTLYQQYLYIISMHIFLFNAFLTFSVNSIAAFLVKTIPEFVHELIFSQHLVVNEWAFQFLLHEYLAGIYDF